jgi:hypothetical protein
VNRGTAALVGALGLLLTLTVPAAAQEQEGEAAPGFELVSQPAWVPLAGEFALELQIPNPDEPIENVEVRVRLYETVTTLAEFQATRTGDLGGRLDNERFPLPSLLRDGDGVTTLTFGLSGSATSPTLGISRPGVYPLEVMLEGDVTFEQFVTWIVAVDGDADARPEPVHLATIWPVETDPARDLDGELDPVAVEEFSPGGRLDRIAQLLDDAGDFPVTLQLGPETLEAWSAQALADPEVAPAVEDVTDAAARRTTQVLPNTYVPIDLTSLEAAGLGEHLADQVVLGSDTLEALTGETPDPRTAHVDPIDAATLARLRGLLVDRVVIGADALAPPIVDDEEEDEDAEGAVDSALDAYRPFALAAGTSQVRAVQASDELRDLLAGSSPAVLRAQQLTAALSLLAYAGEDTPLAAVLAMPPRWQPDVPVFRALVEGLDGHPLITTGTLDDLFEEVPADAERELAPYEPEAFPVTGVRYQEAETNQRSLEGMLAPEDLALDRGQRALDLALSTTYTPEEADDLLGAIDETVALVTHGITTSQKRVVVPSRQFEVPLSFRNDTGRPVTVRVEIDSEKLAFPEGNSQIVELEEGNNPAVGFAVEARASGTFTMTVSLSSPDRNLEIGAPTSVTVRSAAFSGVGAILTGGALVFLLLWWGNHFRRTRRARRAATT